MDQIVIKEVVNSKKLSDFLKGKLRYWRKEPQGGSMTVAEVAIFLYGDKSKATRVSNYLNNEERTIPLEAAKLIIKKFELNITDYISQKEVVEKPKRNTPSGQTNRSIYLKLIEIGEQNNSLQKMITEQNGALEKRLNEIDKKIMVLDVNINEVKLSQEGLTDEIIQNYRMIKDMVDGVVLVLAKKIN